MNVSELGLVTPAGKVVWGKSGLSTCFHCGYCLNCNHIFQLLLLICLFYGVNAGKYAQVTNNPENDGCINAVLLV